MYNYLVVGSGLYGAIFAHEAKKAGKSVLVIDKRPNIAGNIYTEKIEGINVHKYGAHIFHTNNKRVWEYITQFAEFNRFTNSPVANYKGELYSLPFNMYTFNKMWGVVTPEEASVKIEEQRKEAGITEPKNLEEQAISLVGRDIYEKLIKGYTEKQWGRDCKDLPSFIIKRLPVRLTFDNNYFNALYQGIPVGGYTKMVANLLDGIEVRLNMDYLDNKAELDALADKVVYTGAIDAYFDYKLGTLEYRSVRFETETLDKPNFQGNAAVNYTDRETPWTRIIEHKWFEFGKDEDGNELPKTVISREFSSEWKTGDEPYYPVNDEKNGALYAEYKKLAGAEEKVIFGGRLGEYKYYDMDAVIASALDMCEKGIYSNKRRRISMQTTLLIMAAGIGSRFGGGIKQLEPVDETGHIIMDYSIHDAIEAGFNKVVFIIRKDIENEFKEVIGDRIAGICSEHNVTVDYAFQDINDIPGVLSEGRTKPWGTGQAVLAAKDVLTTPFIVINADDYYGKEGFRAVHEYLVNGGQSCMAGFVLKNTLSDNGGVTRGICKMDAENNLTEVVETKNIIKTTEGAEADGMKLDIDSLVSMNMWGLTPDFLKTLEEGFKEFFEKEVPANPLKAEYLIPTFIGELLSEGKISVKALRTNDTWYGMTYKEDVAAVKESFSKMLENGTYKGDLFSDL